MNRSKLNCAIDAAMFLLMMAIVGIGFLMKYVLISGQERWIKYGSNVDLRFLGLDRHSWGRIHLVLGMLLVILLVLHLFLHWKQVVCLVRKLFANKAIRISVSTGFILLSLLALIFPVLISLETGEPLSMGRNEHRQVFPSGDQPAAEIIGTMREAGETDDYIHRKDGHENRIARTGLTGTSGTPPGKMKGFENEIRGHMTLTEISEKYQLSTEALRKEIGLPETAPDDERLGRLRKTYTFTMQDVRDAVQVLNTR